MDKRMLHISVKSCKFSSVVFGQRYLLRQGVFPFSRVLLGASVRVGAVALLHSSGVHL